MFCFIFACFLLSVSLLNSQVVVTTLPLIRQNFKQRDLFDFLMVLHRGMFAVVYSCYTYHTFKGFVLSACFDFSSALSW